LLCGFFAAVSRPPPVASFSLCDLRLFVIKRIFLSFFHLYGQTLNTLLLITSFNVSMFSLLLQFRSPFPFIF